MTSHRGRTVHAQPASRSAMARIVQTVYWSRCRVSIPTAPRKQTRQKRRQGWESVPARMGIIRTCTLIADTPCSNSGHLLIEQNSRTANANTKRMIPTEWESVHAIMSCTAESQIKSNQMRFLDVHVSNPQQDVRRTQSNAQLGSFCPMDYARGNAAHTWFSTSSAEDSRIRIHGRWKKSVTVPNASPFSAILACVKL